MGVVVMVVIVALHAVNDPPDLAAVATNLG